MRPKATYKYLVVPFVSNRIAAYFVAAAKMYKPGMWERKQWMRQIFMEAEEEAASGKRVPLPL